jgi:hypothetical protein
MSLVRGTITRPFYDWDGRKYIEFRTENQTVLRAKVPWRYNRVMCHVEGIRPIQDIRSGESVEFLIEKKIWDGESYWIVISVRPVEP